MERKIGEIFEHNGEWYQCVEGNCAYCSIQDEACEQRIINDVCRLNRIFKKLEKVGEPYIIGNKLIQRYKIYPTTYHINVYGWYYQNLDVKSWTIDIEIKQTKEDMEENKLNLKPFDIQKAREGKPICTRDGRKARIICFDRIDAKPILALVSSTDGKGEDVFDYFVSGKRIANVLESDLDLMMLTEKKEGWAKIRKDINLYKTKEEADRKMIGNDEYVTAKVCWEE